MFLLSVLLIPIGLVIDLLAASAIIAGWPVSANLVVLLIAHLIGAGLVALGVYFALPRIYRAPTVGALAYIALSAVLAPVLGPLGLTLAMLGGLYLPYREKPRQWDTLEIPDLPFQPVPVEPNDVFLRDGLSSVLMHFDDRNRRQQAIAACRHLPRRQAVPILRSALGDSADEVRLLAYAMLNSIERDLERQIATVQDTIAAGGDPDGELHEEKAQLFWEFSYLQLARGSVEELMLTKARDAIDIAIERQATAQRWLLRARICLELAETDATEEALTRAEQLGLEEDDSAPRWAELAFRRGHFDAVAPALRRMSEKATSNPVMRPVVEYWL